MTAKIQFETIKKKHTLEISNMQLKKRNVHTFGVINPTNVGAATPVNAPIPFVTAINEPA